MTKQELMFHLVREQEAGPETVAAFCRSKDINVAKFYYWQRKYRETQPVVRGFIDVTAVGLQSAPSINVSYPNGVQIQLSTSDLSVIAQLIRIG